MLVVVGDRGELGDIKGWGRSWWLTRLGINSAILEDVRQCGGQEWLHWGECQAVF